MLPSERIIKNCKTYLELLKFAIMHDSDPKFKDYSLVNNYIQVLKEVEDNLDEMSNEKVRDKNPLDFDSLLYSLFKDEVLNHKNYSDRVQAIKEKTQEFKKFIDTKEKRKLIRNFELVMDLTDIAIERDLDDEECGGLWWLEEIDKELNKITTYFCPILDHVKKEKNK